jgi:hypothetical protein
MCVDMYVERLQNASAGLRHLRHQTSAAGEPEADKSSSYRSAWPVRRGSSQCAVCRGSVRPSAVGEHSVALSLNMAHARTAVTSMQSIVIHVLTPCSQVLGIL